MGSTFQTIEGEYLLTILQVNVRPALRSFSFSRSQCRENKNHLAQSNQTGQQETGTTTNVQTFADTSMTQSLPHLQTHTNGNGATANGIGGHPILHQQISWSLTPETPVGRALVSAAQRLTGAGCENPRLDAQLLLAHVLGADRTWLFAHHDHPLTVDQAEAFTDLVARRIQREPVAYLIGRKEFYGLDFAVDERVLIPRPETEMLVDFLLAHVQADPKRTFVIADVGTGSGAIAVTTAAHAPNTRIYALDISPDALAVAQENGRRLAPKARLAFLHSDLLTALPEPADVIVANLPYVTDQGYAHLAPEIREYEPQLALTAGEKGLDVIKRLLGQVRNHLNPNGTVLLEIGHEQGPAVKALAEAMRPQPHFVGLRQDYSGHMRMVTIEF
jgi:release factor glutamine methyltransferase